MIDLQYCGQVISQREDGYVSLTQMCVINGKKVNDFVRLKSTQAYLEALESNTNIPVNQLLYTFEGSPSNGGGTWGHPLLAIELGRWISPQFAIWCDQNIKTLMEEGEVSIKSEPVQQLPPKRDAYQYMEVSQYLDKMANPTLKALMTQLMMEELTLGQKALPGNEPRHVTVSVRANELGLGNGGSGLGNYVAKHLTASGKTPMGNYQVKTYALDDRLDEVITSYYR